MTSKNSRRRRHIPQHGAAGGNASVRSQQFQALKALLVVLIVCILIEVLVVDTVFLGPSGRIADVNLSSQDNFPSGTRESYLKKSKSAAQQQHDNGAADLNDANRNELADQYGSEAIIVGLDTCRRYKSILEQGDDGAVMAVRGLFQRRTAFFVQLMRKNCKLPDDESETDMIYNTDVEDHFPIRKFPNKVLPIVVVQDPLPWMTDVCRDRPGELEIDSVARKGCPSLDEPVRVRYLEFKNATTHPSLAHLWNDWYEPWLTHHNNPRLLIRAEDVLLHPQDVVSQVCECIGGQIRDHFRNKAPWHIESVADRMEAYNEDTLQYAIDHLDSALMATMRYSFT